MKRIYAAFVGDGEKVHAAEGIDKDALGGKEATTLCNRTAKLWPGTFSLAYGNGACQRCLKAYKASLKQGD